MRTCPKCGNATASAWCCGIELTAAQPWRMTRERIRAVHVLARSRKGLDEETYRMKLQAVSVKSSLELNRQQFHRLMRALRELPDAPPKKAKAA